MRRALLPPGHEDIAMSLSGLAFLRGRQGRPRESAELYREALTMRLARLGERHPEVARGRQNLAAALSAAGSLDEAAGELTRALAGFRAVYGERHPSVATTLNNAGMLEMRRGRNREAVEYFRESYDMRLERLGAGHPSTLTVQNNLAAGFARLGQLGEAERLMRDVLVHGAAPGSGMTTDSRANTMTNLAFILMQQGRLKESEATVRGAMTLAGERPGVSLQAAMLGTLGRILAAQRRYDEAVAPLQRAFEIRREMLGPDHPDTRRLREALEEARASASR